MIVDASAILVIVNDEPECVAFLEALSSPGRRYMSVVNHFEAAIKVDRDPDPVVRREFDQLVRKSRVELMPVTAEQAAVARAAYRDYGKGSGHPAHLNLGDCFAYALATVTDNPLLYKGNDFVHTDIRSAI